MFPFGFFLHAAVLWLILFIFARHDADRSYSTLFFVSLVIVLETILSAMYIRPWDVLLDTVVCVLLLRRFCYMGWFRAIIATVLFSLWLAFYPYLWERFVK